MKYPRCIACVLLVLGAHPVQADSPDLLESLGTLGGTLSYCTGISADGSVIVGYSALSGDTDFHAYRWQNGVLEDLGTLGGSRSTALGASADGAVVFGTSTNGTGFTRTFRWQNGAMADIGSLGGRTVYGTAMTADGATIVGQSYIAGDSYYHAYRWTAADGMLDLGTLGGDYSGSQAVSADGAVVVGFSYLPGNADQRAFRWTGGTMTDLGSGDAVAVSRDGTVVGVVSNNRSYRWTAAGGLADIGTLGGSIGYMRDMSADGAAITGYSSGSGFPLAHAFHWTLTGGMTDLGTLGGSSSDGRAISADGSTVVGESQVAGDVTYHAYRWTAALGMEDLGTLTGGTRSLGWAVSADGSVVTGYGDIGGGEWRAFVYDSRMLDLGNTQLAATIGATQLQLGAEGLAGALRAVVGDELFVRLEGSDRPVALRATLRGARSGDAASGQLDLAAAVGLPGDLTLGGFVSGAAADSGSDALDLSDGSLGAGLWLRRLAADRTGLTWKVALGHVAGDATVTRSVDLPDTEAGRGETSVSAIVASAEIGYGLRHGATLWTPYLGLTRTAARVAGYTEEDTVDFPVTYGAADLGITTLTLGARARHDLAAGGALTLAAAVEHDLSRNAGTVHATSAIPGLTAFDVTAFEAENRTRLVLDAGFERDLGQGNQITGGLTVAQSPFGDDLICGLRLGFEKHF